MQVFQKIRHIFSFNWRHSERKAPYSTQIIKNDHLQENVKDNPLVALEKDVRILTDDIDIDPIHNFELYSKTVVNMIRTSEPKFCVGISGDWGTGKTTLMKLIENILKPIQFNWEDIPTDDLACEKLKGSLRRKFDLNWLNNMQKFSKAADNKVLELYNEATHNSLSFIINEDMTNVIMKINDDNYCELSTEYHNNGLIVRESDYNILTVWFNAWRYEKEDQLALIALMKTIAYALGEHPIYKKLKPILLRGIGIIGKDILRHFALEYAMTEKGIEELEKKLLPKMELLSKVDKDTIYFDGLNEIEKSMENILEEYHDSRIVVFIDDLDRCSPTKALEVLESIKVFLNIKGFVYIIGLSERTVEKLIDTAFKEVDVKGKEYLQKIIQLQIVVPQWDYSDIRDLVEHIHHNLGSKYSSVVLENKDLIALAMESNPRQVKRFINRFIVSHENSVEQSNPSGFLVLEMLKERWSEFYKNMDIKDFIDKVKNLVTKEDEERIKILNELKARENDKDNPLNEFEKILINFRSDTVLWKFLKKCKDNNTLFGLEQKEEEIKEKVNIHRRASESVKEISDVTSSEDVAKLLLTGKIKEFNAIRQKGPNRYLDLTRRNLPKANLSGADLSNADLSYANLSYADLSYANLSYTKLSYTNLSNANLSKADLSYADLSNADLSKAYLSYANLSNADLSKADLSNADLSKADLSYTNLPKAYLSKADLFNADLSKANLSNASLPFSFLLDCKRYDDMICDGADFQDALTDNQDFMLYLEKNNAKILPLLLNSKGELKNKLEERHLKEDYIQYLLEHSSLP